MPAKYKYKGIKGSKHVNGELEAINRDEAASLIKEQGIIITDLTLTAGQERNKYILFIEKAKSIKVCTWMFFVTFIIFFLFFNLDKNTGSMQVFTRLISSIPAYKGYIADSKVRATTKNHARIKSFITTTFTKCASGATSIVLPGYNNNKPLGCTLWVGRWGRNFTGYFKVAGFKNPHKPTEQAVFYSNSGKPPIGRTELYGSGSNILAIRTQIGTTTGGSTKVLEDIIYK